jgi:MFS family permease
VSGGYSPLESGIALLPLTVIMLVLSSRSGRLATRIGPRLQMSVGPVVVGAGLALLARVGTDSDYVTGVLPAVLVFGLGLAVTVAPLTATALSSVPDEHAGLASAVNNDVARVGALVAVAVLPALAGLTGADYLRPAQLSSGFRTAALLSAGLCLVGGALAAVGIRNPELRPRRPPGSPPPSPTPEFFHCALEGSPLVDSPARAPGPAAP